MIPMTTKMKSFRVEVVAGTTTFLTTAYIVAINPSLLSQTGMPFSGVLTATVLLAFSMTLLMGVYAKLPYAVAPGMGINAYFTYSLVLGRQIPWSIALGMVFWAGVLFLALSVFPVRVRIARSIPPNLRSSAAVGIGLFLTFIGLKNAGWVVADSATLIRLGQLGKPSLLALFGLLVMVWFLRRKNPLSFLIGIGLVTLIAWVMGLVDFPRRILAPPDFDSVLGRLDIMGALKLSLAPAIIGICFTDLFDSISTFVGVSQAAGLTDKNGDPKNLSQGLVVDAVATLGAGLLGTSPGTAYIESAAGIEAGGRTGLTAVVCAFCFLPCLFLSPLVAMIPAFATAPALILVGASMFRTVKSIHLDRWEDLIPGFMVIVLIPLTFSITQGILWGFVLQVVCYGLAGRLKEISNELGAMGLLSAILILIEQLGK